MDCLKFISEQMALIEVPYEFGEWTSKITGPYFVGEKPSGESYPAEDGSVETTIFVTGFHRGKLVELMKFADKIRKHFNPVFGLRSKTGSGSIAVFFDCSFPIPTGEADLKKIQINLTIKEWKGAV